MDSDRRKEVMPLPAGVAVIGWVVGLACVYASLFVGYLAWLSWG